MKFEDEETEIMQNGGGSGVVRAMLVLKMGCQQWVDDFGIDASGHVFKAVKTGEEVAKLVARGFCSNRTNLCGKEKKERQKQERAKERAQEQKRRELRRHEDGSISAARIHHVT